MTDELERLYELLYLLPVGVVAFDSAGVVGAANPLSVQLMNPFVAPTAMHNAFLLLAPLMADLRELIERHDGRHVVVSRRRVVLAPDGRAPMTVEFSVNCSRPGQFVAILADVTDLVLQERELRRERDRIRVIVEMVREYAIFTTDRTGHVDSWNASGQRLFGLTTDQAIQRSLDELVDSQGEPLGDVLEEAVLAGWRRVRGWSTGPDDMAFYSDTMISTLADDAGRPEGFVVIVHDASEVRQREEDLRREADTDPLTALANRRGFDARASRLIRACEVNGVAASVLMIDIDHFKLVNDTYGHDTGDRVLRAVSDELTLRLRAIDLVGRFGGEEFAVLLPGTTGDAAVLAAEALRSAVEMLGIETLGGQVLRVRISIGVAQLEGDLPRTLLRADSALYAAKEQGRNRVVSA